jgi:hypothetical protein
MTDVSPARKALDAILDDALNLIIIDLPREAVEDAATGLDLDALLAVRGEQFPGLLEATVAVAVESDRDFLLESCEAALGDTSRCDTETRCGFLDVVGLVAQSEPAGESPDLRTERREWCRRIASPWVAQRSKDIRGAAAVALARCGEQKVLAQVVEGRIKIPVADRVEVVGLLGGMTSWLVLVDLGARMSGLDCQRLNDAAERLGDRVGMTMAAGEEMYAALMMSTNCLMQDRVMEYLLGAIAAYCPIVYRRHVRRWIGGSELGPLEVAAFSLKYARGFDPKPMLLRLTAPHQEQEVIKAALNSLFCLDPEMAGRVAVTLLDHESWRVRQWALTIIGSPTDPAYLEPLLRATGDVDDDVREAALRGVFGYDNPRVTTAVLAALNAPEEKVRATAHSLLIRHPERWRHHAWYRDEPGDVPWWQPLMEELAAIVAWGETLGHELLGCPVRIVQYRQGLGRTLIKRQMGVVDVEISDVPLLSGHPHGADVLRGLILHELGHHLFDIGQRGRRTMAGIATAEGVRMIFDILIDEQLERRLRSRNPEWGVWLDRLTSYAFAKERNAAPLQAPPLLQFLHHLRCRADEDRCPTPQVAAALRAVPRNLKNLDHAGVLKTARAVADVIGRDASHHRDMRRLRRLLEKQRQHWEALQALLDRLAAAGINPGDLLGPAVPLDADDDDQSRPVVPGFARRSRLTHVQPPVRGGLGRGRYNARPGEEFLRLREEVTLHRDAAEHAALVRIVARHVRVLRPYLERLGLGEVSEGGQRRGRRLDRAAVAGALVRRSPDMFVHDRQVLRSDCYIGIVIDRSGSMADNGKIERAQAFGALVAEAAAHAPGVTGHVNAFDGERFIRLGTFRNHAVASLRAGDGNNDSGGLLRAAELAQASGRRRRLLVMISDGMPTECTLESLQALVRHLATVEGIVCAQVAVDELPEVAFPHFVDLSAMTFDEAVARFGRLVVSLTSSWR